MQFTPEFKAAIKQLKAKNDFAYQAGINDTLDLIEEMPNCLIITEQQLPQKTTHEVAQRNTQETAQENAQLNSNTSKKLTAPDFSAFENLAKSIEAMEIPQAVKLEIPQVASPISESDLDGTPKQSTPTHSISEHPAFQGWGSSDDDEEDEEEIPKRTNEIATEAGEPNTHQQAHVVAQENTHEDTQGIPEPEVKISEEPTESSARRASAALIAQAQAAAKAEALENEDEEYDE